MISYDKEKEALLLSEKDSFTQEMFGGEPKRMNNSPFPPPPFSHPRGVHPRVYVKRDKLDEIKKILDDPQYAHLKERFFLEADREDVDGHRICDGFYEEEMKGEKYRYNYKITASLEAKALAYLLTGNKIYGYEAIIGAKNIILTLKYTTLIHSTPVQGARHVILVVSKVYDWCYDLLTDDDKRQLIGGLSNLMIPQFYEWEFPPANMSAVSGHGTGPFFLTLCVMMALSFADEMPDWWNFIIGRYYAQYVPVILEQTRGGWVSQGTACYGPGKFMDGLVPGWMLYVALGEFPYNIEDMKKASYFILSHEMANGKMFGNGDGLKRIQGCDNSYLWGSYMVSALTNDKTLALYIKERSGNFSVIAPDYSNDFTVARLLTMLAYMPRTEADDSPFDKLDTVQSFDFPAAQITARRRWREDSPVVMMKTGNMTMSNHDNYDHGTFQIYYKGIQAGSSGDYTSYGNLNHLFYHQATVAYNGLLIFNEDLYDKEPVFITDPSHDKGNNSVVNRRRHYYSGSQKYRFEPGTIGNWLGGDYDMAEVLAVAKGVGENGEGKYAYTASDITKAYHKCSAEHVERKMLAVFTDGDFPLRFFTYDTIESADGRRDIRKTFLLHTYKEPVINKEKKTAVSVNEGGRLTLHSLFGAGEIEKIGGEGFAYWLSSEKYRNEDGSLAGKNCMDRFTKDDRSRAIWGRIDLVTEGNVRDELVNAMYVSDAECEMTAAVDGRETDSAYIARIEDTAAVFTKSDTPRYEEFEFDAIADGSLEYYVSGLEFGTWSVYADGSKIFKATVTKDCALLIFKSSGKRIKLVPECDVLGKCGGRIRYDMGSFTTALPKGAPLVYKTDEDTPLPLPTHPYKRFVGWYTKRTLDEDSRIEFIPKGMHGEFKVYSKWLFDYTNLSFEDSSCKNIGTSDLSHKPVMSRDAYKTDENGEKYLEWSRTQEKMYFKAFNRGKNISDSEENEVSFEIMIRKDADAPLVKFGNPMLKTGDGWNPYHSVGGIPLFRYLRLDSGDAEIRASFSDTFIDTVSADKVSVIRFVINFELGTIRYLDYDGKVITEDMVSLPKEAIDSGLKSLSEWKQYLMMDNFIWSAEEDADYISSKIRLYNIKVAEGNIFG